MTMTNPPPPSESPPPNNPINEDVPPNLTDTDEPKPQDLFSQLSPNQREILSSFRAAILSEFPELAEDDDLNLNSHEKDMEKEKEKDKDKEREERNEKSKSKSKDPNSPGIDDTTLIRFLRARSFSLKASLAMYRACLTWRRTVLSVGMDELYKRTDPWGYPEREEVFSKWPIWFHKTDKMGRPINIQTFGAIDIPALHRAVPPQRHWETVLVNAESITREVFPAASKQAGTEISNGICIIDLKGFGLSQFWGMKTLVRDSFQVSQDYYPETMGRLLVINAPTSFTAIWSVVKPWLAKETVGKIDILGGNYREELLRVIDAENLPEQFGGRCRCAEGCEKSNAGPWKR